MSKKSSTEECLTIADLHIEAAEQRIRQQKRRLFEMAGRGEDVSQKVQFLALLHQALRTHRDFIGRHGLEMVVKLAAPALARASHRCPRASPDLTDQLLTGQQQTFLLEKRYVTRQGRAIRTHLPVSLLRDEDGLPRYFIAVVADIQEKKVAELALQQLNADMEQRIEPAPGPDAPGISTSVRHAATAAPASA